MSISESPAVNLAPGRSPKDAPLRHMTDEKISQLVRKMVTERLYLDDDSTVVPEATITGELDMESIDVIDLLFYLERDTGVRIQPSALFPSDFRKSKEDFIKDGKVTEAGIAHLKKSVPHAIVEIDQFAGNDPQIKSLRDIFTVRMLTQFLIDKKNALLRQ